MSELLWCLRCDGEDESEIVLVESSAKDGKGAMKRTTERAEAEGLLGGGVQGDELRSYVPLWLRLCPMAAQGRSVLTAGLQC